VRHNAGFLLILQSEIFTPRRFAEYLSSRPTGLACHVDHNPAPGGPTVTKHTALNARRKSVMHQKLEMTMKTEYSAASGHIRFHRSEIKALAGQAIRARAITSGRMMFRVQVAFGQARYGGGQFRTAKLA
jgi:hypothetical protein